MTSCLTFARLPRRQTGFHLEVYRVPTESDFATLSRIGTDESGKGDYFGPLVIAAVFVSPVIEQQLIFLGVRDSKKLSDGRIMEIAPEIRRFCPHSTVSIGPQRYNDLYAKIKNLNRLLAWGHARALENLLQQVDCDLAIADQFGDEGLILHALQEKGKQIRLIQRPKAEADVAVAAASILARAEFLRRLTRLSEELRILLPKGASPAVELAGRAVIKTYGQDRLQAVAKLHFSTTKRILPDA